MLHRLIDRSPDLKRLRDEGYDVGIVADHLVIRHVPYVTSGRDIRFGTLVSTLRLAGEATTKPDTHVAHFIGDYPCNMDGTPIDQIRHTNKQKQLGGNLTIDRSFSNKPVDGYDNYYHKMTTYINIISGPAQALDNSVSPRSFRVIESDDNESVFHYMDTASSRAGIGALSAKCENKFVAIIGLGGTGAYVLDLIAKTKLKEIHLFDGDSFLQHNAFRSPGAASLEVLGGKPAKVAYLKSIYSVMRRGIVDHDEYVTDSHTNVLKGMDFAFVCVDGGPGKRAVIAALESAGVDFIDVGMGLELNDEKLMGQVRVTASTSDHRDHLRKHVDLDAATDDLYTSNIQIAELNALNAALAVIKWKKMWGIYADLENEMHSVYAVDGNHIINN